MKRTVERREGLTRNEIGINEEVAHLATTLSWGPTGVEALLASLIPERHSLFFEKMDVLAARRQYETFESLLESRGACVIRVKDLAVASLLRRGGILPARDLTDLQRRVNLKAESLFRKYGRSETVADDCIAQILEEDAKRYGEEGAIRLNAALVQIDTEALPMANLLFGRDQSNVVGQALLWSNMQHPIRRPEVDLWKLATDDLLTSVETVSVSGEGKLEGGDTIVHNGDCLVGVGGRSNLKGIEQISESVLSQGFRMFVVYHSERDRGLIEHQTTMHLDTFYMPGPKGTAVVLMEEAQQRSMIEVVRQGSTTIFRDRGTFADYLVASGEDIIPLTRDQQIKYQANYVVVDSGCVLLTVFYDGYLKHEFDKRGIEVIGGGMESITSGYGGAHCSLTPILRV